MTSRDFEYIGVRRVRYGDGQFVPVCPTCRRFVKADASVQVNGEGEIRLTENAVCSNCGRVEMPFEGYFES